MKTIERLEVFIQHIGLSLAKFDVLIGAGNGYIGKQIKRKASVGSDVLEKIVSIFPDLSVTWLVTGKDEMLISAQNTDNTPVPTTQFTTHNYTLSADTPSYFADISADKLQKADPPADPPSVQMAPQIVTIADATNTNIVLVPVKAQAGYLNGYGDPDYFQKLQSFRLPGLNHGIFRAFEIRGESMAPTLKNREIIIGEYVSELSEIKNDFPHVVLTKNDGVVVKRLVNGLKQWGYLLAKSDANGTVNDFPDYEIFPDDVLEVWRGVAHISRAFDTPSDVLTRINNVEANIHAILKQLKEQR
jgi:phage repressor protein C with HTH and peptisase S24 domain